MTRGKPVIIKDDKVGGGTITVRVSRVQHKKFAKICADQGVSMNQKLAKFVEETIYYDNFREKMREMSEHTTGEGTVKRLLHDVPGDEN